MLTPGIANSKAMEIISTPWHVVGASLVWLTGAAVCLACARIFRVRRERALVLYCWHTLFSLVYLYYVLNYGGDAIAYYRLSLSDELELAVGTEAVQVLTALFSRYFGLSILGAFLGYNIFGSIGLIAFDGALRFATAGMSRSVQYFRNLIIFLPSVSFWSSAIGKDAVSFMAAGIALWGAQDRRARNWMMGLALLLMLSVRPHVATVMLFAFIAASVVRLHIAFVSRAALIMVTILMATFVVPFALEYAGVWGESQPMDLERYIELRQSYNMTGGGAIDISQLSFPMKLLTYMYRPLPFEAHSLTALATSIDNLVLVALTILAASGYAKGRRPWPGVDVTFLLAYSVTAWVMLALTTANLGISVRQKWMFAPMLIFLFLSVAGRRRKVASRQNGRAECPVRGAVT